MVDKTKPVTGYCPLCHEIVACEAITPEYPDDPMLEETDCFKVVPHGECSGAGKHPTAFPDEGPDDTDPPDEDEFGEPDEYFPVLGDLDDYDPDEERIG